MNKRNQESYFRHGDAEMPKEVHQSTCEGKDYSRSEVSISERKADRERQERVTFLSGGCPRDGLILAM